MSLICKDLCVTFKNGVRAVDHVDLEIPAGVYGLLGENGAGKTTLMRVLTTILEPNAGGVALNGISYEAENLGEIRKRIGYLPQELNLYPNLTVQECLEYMGALSGIPGMVCRKRIAGYLERTSLGEHRKKKMRQLSGGMKRRVGLIQALLNEPEFLIVDEPTTGLDPEERVRIRNLLVDVSRECSVLFSTHVVEDLAATCSRLAVMRKGRILYAGSAAELVRMTKGHVWTCVVKDEEVARRLEQRCYVSSKQYTQGGMKLRIISEAQPEFPCSRAETGLEDAYMYLMSQHTEAPAV